MARYYWLKMRRDFFKRHDLRIVERTQPDGKEIVLFYLKLLVESVDHEGALRYSEAKPYTPEMLATITDTTPDFAAQALEVLADLELIKDAEDGTILLPQAVELIGSASDTDNAKRQARYREAHRNEKTSVTQNNAESNAEITKSNAKSNKAITHPITNNNESIETETDIETDIEKNTKRERANFIAPTHDAVLSYMTSYCFEKSLSLDPVIEAEKFFNYYTANGWRVGRNKMRDYKAAARNWLANAKDYAKPDPNTNPFTDILGGDF